MPTARKKKRFRGPAYVAFVDKLKMARADSGLTQRQVAKKIGFLPSTFAKVEMGERRVDVIELQELARLYKKPIRFFIGD